MEIRNLRMVDVRDPEVMVEVILSADLKTLWVNVDGLCVLRVQTSQRALPLITENISGDAKDVRSR